MAHKLVWSYGVTTVPERFTGLLPRTLASLAQAGFTEPRLFVDGATRVPEHLEKYNCTFRNPKIRTHGNWILSAYELYLRDPDADRYAIFQDDFVTYPNLRQYLEACKYPKIGYWNLYTFPENEKKFRGWFHSNQLGKGAVALVFNNEALRVLLRQQHMVDRATCPNRGWRAIDGGIVTSMKNAGWKEWVHNPSLVQHTGDTSSMGNGHQEKAPTFLGEDFDAMGLLDQPIEEAPTVVTPNRIQRLGLVGYNCNTGLGELNRQIATYGEIQTWLVKPHPKYHTNPASEYCDTIICPIGKAPTIEKFVQSVDCVVFCEMPFYDQLIDYCRKYNKRTVCVPMMEWMPPGAKGWPQQVDLFLCPTKDCYDQFAHVVPCVYFPWPVDITRFNYEPRETCDKFLFLGGHGGFKGRKGIEIVKQAKKLWPSMPLVVSSQEPGAWPPGTEVIAPATLNSDLYAQGDVLIAPHSVDGLGLEPMEAMASGLPVVTTDGLPWNEIPSIGKIPASIINRSVRRPVHWHVPSAEKLVEICKSLLGKSIQQESIAAREWAVSRDWATIAPEFIKLVKSGQPVRVAS